MSTRLVLTLAVGLALPALADIAPKNSRGCSGKQPGAACTTDDGSAGTCTEQLVSRPDYSNGPPPTYKQVKMVLCVATAPASARVPSLFPTLGGLLLALLATGAALVARRHPGARPSPT